MPPLPKGKTRKQLKAKRDRHEANVIRAVRAAVAERDVDCRIWWSRADMDGCEGELEWCHLGEWKRYATRKMAPEKRHHTRGSFMACTKHHRMYDAGELVIEYGPDGADGPLKVYRKAA